jgi:hypothetical protein
MISTRVHGLLDYAVSGLVISMPWTLQFKNGGAETWVPVVLGASTILYSLFTNYEWAVFRFIPMPSHLILDAISAVTIGVSPWLFAFQQVVFLPFVIVAAIELLVVSFSRR